MSCLDLDPATRQILGLINDRPGIAAADIEPKVHLPGGGHIDACVRQLIAYGWIGHGAGGLTLTDAGVAHLTHEH